jgi:hypothetical protein
LNGDSGWGEEEAGAERNERCPRGGEENETRRMIHKQVNLCAHVFLYTILYAPTLVVAL